jgi:hypothetical protein
MKISTKDFIKEWNGDQPLQEAFNHSIYDYALYTCGGDFSIFDDVPTLTNLFTITFNI